MFVRDRITTLKQIILSYTFVKVLCSFCYVQNKLCSSRTGSILVSEDCKSLTFKKQKPKHKQIRISLSKKPLKHPSFPLSHKTNHQLLIENLDSDLNIISSLRNTGFIFIQICCLSTLGSRKQQPSCWMLLTVA